MKLVSADKKAMAYHDARIRQVFESAGIRASTRITESIHRTWKESRVAARKLNVSAEAKS
jgi:hypothetical protein